MKICVKSLSCTQIDPAIHCRTRRTRDLPPICDSALLLSLLPLGPTQYRLLKFQNIMLYGEKVKVPRDHERLNLRRSTTHEVAGFSYVSVVFSQQ